MLTRTHLSFGIFLGLTLMFYFDDKLIFFLMILVGSIFPDLDSEKSIYGRYLIFRPFQVFIKHRGILHSLIIAIFLSLIVNYFVNSLGFFVGYISHLFLDSLTKQGIVLFWPFSFKVKGSLISGGFTDEILFLFLVSFNVLIFIFLVISYFGS